MITTIALATVAVVLFIWVTSTRTSRTRWVKELDLLGTWVTEDDDDVEASIVFHGDFDGGEYTHKSNNVVKKGNWQIKGSNLILSDVTNGGVRYDLRKFDERVIGIDGPGIEKQIFTKRMENIVHLKRNTRR